MNKQQDFELGLREPLKGNQLVYLAKQLETKADKNNDGKISKNEWEAWVEKNGSNFSSKSMAGNMMSLYSPSSIGVTNDYDSNRWLICSDLIYDPHRRREAWRFITYMFLHGSHQHITMNIIMQLFVGIPLEMSQPGWMGCLRVGCLYMAGVVLGSLAAGIFTAKSFLVGASAGVYALIAAHLATLILNWHEDGIVYNHIKSNQRESRVPQVLNPVIRGLRLAFVILFVTIDVGQILYTTYVLKRTSSTSNVGHAFGAVAGILIGAFVLENRKVEEWEKIFKWISFATFGIVLCIFISWHIVGSQTGWFPDEEWGESTYCKV